MKIEIRHAEPDDYLAVQKIYMQPGVIAGTLQIPYPPSELHRKRLAEPREGSISLVAVVEGEVVGGEVVGQLGLHTFPHSPRRKHVGDIGMGVRDDWQGKGVGSALMAAMVDLADNWLNLRRVELTVYVDNMRAIALYKRFGFAIEGAHVDYAFRNGEYVDTYAMARVRDVRNASVHPDPEESEA
ncbi:MAG: GNAT family N-acetyltransferase [Caldilineaceae bacterium]